MALKQTKLAEAIAGSKGGGTQAAPVEQVDNLHSESIAHILDLVSEGEIRGLVNGLQSVYFDETPVANADDSRNFENVTVDFRSGTQDQSYITGIPSVENEIHIGVELRSSSPWTRTFTNAALSAVKVSLAVNALTTTNTTNGNITGGTVSYAIDLSVDGGAFETVITNSFVGKTTMKFVRDHRVDLPSANENWTIRVRRLTPNSTSTAVQDITMVESVAEIIDAKLRYPNSALLGITLNAKQFPNIPTRAFDLYGRIIRVPSNYDPETRVYTGIWDGTFKPAWSDNPAWVLYDLILHTRYGLGHLVDQSLPDKWSLYKIARYCDEMVSDGIGGMEPRFTCNLYLQQRGDAFKVIRDLNSIFRGISYWAAGSILTSADMPQDPMFLYTAANVVGGDFTYQGSARKERHTVALVSWNDMTDFGRAKVEYVEDVPGIERYGIQQIEVTAVGCTSRSQARRLGKWILLTERYETDTVTFSVGLDGSIAAPGQLIMIADELRAGRRIGGRIRGASLNSVTVDAAPIANVGDTITVVLPDAVAETRTIGSIDGDGTILHVTEDFSEVPLAETVWAVESGNLAAQRYRVISVAEGTSESSTTFTITALEHAAGKFDEVDFGVAWEKPNITSLPAKVQLPPKNIVITHREVAGEVYAGTAVTVSWDPVDGAVAYGVKWRQNTAVWIDAGQTAQTSIEIFGIVEGTFEVEISAISAVGVHSPGNLSMLYQVPDQTAKPGMVKKLDDQMAAAEAAAAQEVLDRIQADAEEAQTRLDQITAEAQARADQITTESQNRAAAILAEAQARADAILNEQLARESAITTEQMLRQTADDSLAQAISTVVAGTGEQFDSKKVWYFDTDLELWSGNGVPTITDGFLRPVNSTSPYLLSPTGLGVDGTQFRYCKARVKRTGAPAWKGELRWRLEGDTAGSWRGPVTAAVPNFDEASGDASIDFKDVNFLGNVDQIRLDLFEAQTDTDSFSVDWVAIGRPAPGASTAALQDEALARVQADSAESTSRQTLAAQVRGTYEGTDVAALTSGLLYNERVARVTADEAVSTQISDLTVRVSTAESSLINELITRATKDSAMAGSLNLMETRLTDAENTVTGASSIVQTYDSRLTATEQGLNSQSSSLLTLTDQVTSLDGTLNSTNTSLSNLTSRVTTTEGKIDSQGDSILTLNSSVNSLQTGLTGANSSISALDSRVTASENSIVSQGNSITSLQSSLADANGNISTNASALDSVSTRVSSVEGVNSAQASSISSLTTTVNGHTSTITSQQTSINGVLARAGVRTDVNGYITGWTLNNDGQMGDMAILADKFSIVSPSSADSLTWQNGILIARSGAFMKATGPGFGQGAEFIEWYGPYMDVASCSRSAAIYYMTKTGAAYFGGSLSAGIFKNAAESTQFSTTASVETGAFGTNGNPKTVAVSFSYADGGTLPGNSVSTYRNRATSATVTIQRSYNGGAWTTINTFTATGTTTADYDTEFGQTQINVNCGGSITLTDSLAGTGSFNYKALLSNAVNWPITFAGHQGTQRLSVISTE